MRPFLVSSEKAFLLMWLNFCVIVLLCAPAAAQETNKGSVESLRPLITAAVDEAQLTVLKGNTHPLARPEFDLGTAPATLPMERMLLVLKRSADQETALRTLLDNQQDKKSPSYHKWVTPEQFGQQFGPTDTDLQTITGWLQSHGFQVGSTKGRTVLEFSGSASQVQEAFHTTIHKYIVNGEQHWANANDPSIPTALTPAVAGVLTLHNFIKKPTINFTGERVPAKIVTGKKPQVTFPPQNGQPAMNALAPQDYAVIYDINPVYASDTIGRGMTIGVIARSNLFQDGEDVQNFFSEIGYGNGVLDASNIEIIVNGPDPGDLGGGDEAEATLDATWSSAIAPDATIHLTVSATTNTTDGIDLSETYIVENNIADVMTESFSACELYATDAQLAGASALAEQAAAQGISYFVSTGDNGAEGCDDPSTAPATHPISVNYLASTAFNVAVGGTMFNENGEPSKYWTSAKPFAETAISYIPEDTWNESSPTKGLWAGGGGASAGNIQSGAGTTQGVPKPSWQYGVLGIPNDGVRDLPDVSLTAAGHDPYLLCLEGSCQPNSQGEIGVYLVSGTSAATPSFAGLMALVDQQIGGREGLANYVLYRLAAVQGGYLSQCNGSSTSAPPASTCIFNDVTVGNNVVPGEDAAEYPAGVGYDLTTGLGSVNVSNLVTQWNSATFTPTTTALTLNGGTAVNITHGQLVPIQATVAPNSGTGTPTGDLVLFIGMGGAFGTYPSSMETFRLSGGQVVSSSSGLPGGSYNIFAHYGGDSTYAPSDSGLAAVNVSAEPSTTTVSVLTANQSGQSIPFTNGPFGSFVYVRADVAGQSGYGVPTGTVTFTDSFGAIPGGATFALNSQGNTANPNGVFNFDTGTHTISASYSGDPSFNPSSTTQSQTFMITPGFYAAISTAQAGISIKAPGSSGSTSMSIANSTGFSGTISLACSGLPSEATCAFSPTSVKANGTPTTTAVTVSVSTTAATTAASERSPYLPAQWMIGMGLLFSVVFVGGRKQGRRVWLMPFILAATLAVASCGGGGGGSTSTPPPPPPNTGTPTGTYNVVVNATSGSTVSSTGFTLVVQ